MGHYARYRGVIKERTCLGVCIVSELVQSRERLPQAGRRRGRQDSLPGENEIWNELFRTRRNLVSKQEEKGSMDVGSRESQGKHRGARDRSLES